MSGLHPSHASVARRLKRAHGHLANVIAMLEAERPCMELAQQLQAVEKAIGAAKKALIHDHLDHCLEDVMKNRGAGSAGRVAEFKDITKYL